MELFKSLFRGRQDVFALRREKGNKAAYRPEYRYNWMQLQRHIDNGGTFASFKGKKPSPLDDKQLRMHLSGSQFIGVYPLLKDNTSWFIAADFDKENWAEECRKLIVACEGNGIPAYLERSRSGNGGHVWIFFDRAYSAVRSRRILLTILRQSSLFPEYDKTSSYDRLFPNQDYHSGKGMGNLIALPLHGHSVKQENTCFVDGQLHPYPDQWAFLATIRRVSTDHLDSIYEPMHSGPGPGTTPPVPGKLIISLSNSIQITRQAIPVTMRKFLKSELNIYNKKYGINKNNNKSTRGMVRYFNFIEETDDLLIVPKGFTGELLRFCKQQNLKYEFKDKRRKHKTINFTTNFQLRFHQVKAIEAASKKDFGIICGPPASGKTVMALQIIADKKQPALIVVQNKQIFDQWVERIEAFLGIPGKEIGKIGQGKARTGKAVTVAMIQSLNKQLEKDEGNELTGTFGTVIIDECHHIAAPTYYRTIAKLTTYYQYGLTATAFRNDGEPRLLTIHLGKIIAEIKEEEIEEYKRARVVIRETSLDVPYNDKTDQFETLSRVLIHDSSRNRLIINDVIAELNKGRKAVIITERKEHIGTMYQYLKQAHEIITLSGDDTEKSRKEKWKLLHEGHYNALITTGQFFGEGSDLKNASCLFLVYPFTFKGKLIQYIGRVQRSEITPVIYDYRDRKIEYLNRRFLKRNKYYRSLERHATLFDDPVPGRATAPESGIKKKIRVPIAELDFRYGAIAFIYRVPGTSRELEFEVENDAVRPEFDVLKPYFSRQLKSSRVEVEIFAEFEDEFLVSQSARSEALERINNEIIESVKFRFLEQDIVSKQYSGEKNDALLDINMLQEGLDTSYYKTGESLLEDLLQDKKVKHHRQLRYLASKHEGSILKLRFVLNPFAFAFLLAGKDQYHIVLETLDTEEATYIWHFDNNKKALPGQLEQVNRDLDTIRTKGRQAFLGNHSANFTRLIHDYRDERKGFVVWKDRLEERLL